MKTKCSKHMCPWGHFTVTSQQKASITSTWQYRHFLLMHSVIRSCSEIYGMHLKRGLGRICVLPTFKAQETIRYLICAYRPSGIILHQNEIFFTIYYFFQLLKFLGPSDFQVVWACLIKRTNGTSLRKNAIYLCYPQRESGGFYSRKNN